jgi:hypothetical protein
VDIQLRKVRLAFPALFEPKSFGEGDAAYSASLLIEPGSDNARRVEEAIENAAAEKWGTKAKQTLAELKAKDKVCLHDGSTKASYDGFEGMLFVSSRNKSRPTVIDRDKTPLIAADGRPYAGCYVNAIVSIYAQDNTYGKRVNASLTGVQFHSDGDAFTGGAPASPDQFDDLSEGADAEDALA